MSDEPVAVVLDSLNLEKHTAAFISEGVTLTSDLILLSDTDMKEIGLNIGERNRLKCYLSSSSNQPGFIADGPPGPLAGSKPEPTPEERERYMAIFRAIDEDGSGEIDFDEFVSALKKLDMYQSNIESRYIFDEADEDNGGTLDIEEFVQLLQNSKGGRSGQMGRLAGAGHEVLNKLNEKSPISISAEDVVGAEVTDAALEEVNRLLEDGRFSWMPSVGDCSKDSCTFLFNLLVLDLDLIKQFVSVACTAMLGELEAQLREIGEYGVLSSVNTDAVENDSIRIFVIIIHRYAHQSLLTKDSITERDMGLLHSFRKAAVLVACNKSMQEVREAIVEYLKRQVAMNSYASSGSSHRSYATSFAEGVAKGAASNVAADVAMGALEAGCSIM